MTQNQRKGEACNVGLVLDKRFIAGEFHVAVMSAPNPRPLYIETNRISNPEMG